MGKKRKRQKAPPKSRPPAIQVNNLGLPLFVIGIVAFSIILFLFRFTQDDAYITFRYAANFLGGHGLVYNIGERVEGYTNFLWLIMVILGRLVGIPYILFTQALGLACGLGTLAYVYRLGELFFGKNHSLAGLVVILTATVYSFSYWSVSGLETAAFALTVTAAVYHYLRRDFLACFFPIVATLIRPEGGLLFLFLFIAELIRYRSLTVMARAMLAFYVIFLLPYGIFKLVYFQKLLPNPFYAKTSFHIKQIFNGFEYSGQYFFQYLGAGLFVIPLLATMKKAGRDAHLLYSFLFVYLAYITFIGGDVLKVHRFFVPIIPAMIVAVVYGIKLLLKKPGYVWLATAVILAWQLYFPYDHVTTFHIREKGLAYKMNGLIDRFMASDSSNFSIAVSTIGLVGYKLLGHTVIDMLGLTDSTIARHPEPPIEGMESTWRETNYNTKYLLSRQPNYILFSTGFKPSAPAERALFLHTAFLNHYRTIGFYYSHNLHNVFKLISPITEEIKRDVDVRFVQDFNEGINTLNRGNATEAYIYFDSAIQYSPKPTYPYLLYYRSLAERRLGDLKASYYTMVEAVKTDTMVYEIYKDLYLYAYKYNRMDLAKYYREQTLRLVPWYVPRLDSLVSGQLQAGQGI